MEKLFLSMLTANVREALADYGAVADQLATEALALAAADLRKGAEQHAAEHNGASLGCHAALRLADTFDGWRAMSVEDRRHLAQVLAFVALRELRVFVEEPGAADVEAGAARWVEPPELRG